MRKATQKLRLSLFLLSSVFVFSFFSSVTVSKTAYADAVTGSENAQGIAELTERWMRYRAIAKCYYARDVDSSTFGSIRVGSWFKKAYGGDPSTSIGYLNDDGQVSCGDTAFVTNSLNKIGFASNLESYCSMWTARRGNLQVKKNDDTTINACISGNVEGDTDNFDMDGSNPDQVEAFKSAKAYKVADSADFPFEGDGTGKFRYWLGLQSLQHFCGGTRGRAYIDSMAGNVGAAKRQVVVNEVNLANGKVERYVYNLQEDDTKKFTYAGVDNDLTYAELTCQDMAKLTWDYDESFGTFVKQYNIQNPDDKGDGFGSDDGTAGDDTEESTTSCAIDGIGWIICPVMNFMAEANEAAFDVIEDFLTIRPSLVQDEATVKAWSSFRDLANIAFVIAFLVIIYSQITGMGVSNYGIKKLLPKIAAAAILVNLSLFICQILVDVSNIAGSSLYSFIANLVEPLEGSEFDSGSAWSTIMTGVLIAGVGVLLIAMVVTAPVVLLAVGLVLLILVARQAFILILVIIAPLAFVAYLLPNTEDFFKKWWKALSATLLIYPIIAVVFGASELASNILMGIASDEGNTSAANMNDDSQLLAIVALAVMAVPLFALPALLKGAMAGAGSIGARLQGMADKSQGRASAKGKARLNESAAGQFMQYRQQRKSTNRAMARAGQKTGTNKNPLNWGRNATAAVMGRVNESGVSGKFGDRLTAAGTAIADKEWDEEVKRQKTSMTSMDHADLMKVMKDKSSTAERRAAAAGTIMGRGYREGHLQALEAAHEMNGKGDIEMSGIQKQMAYDMKEKPWALSDSAIGQLQTGNYGKATSSVNPETGATEVKPPLPTITQDIASRTGTKLSAASLTSMNPDELKRMHKLAMSGQLSDGALANFRSAINEARSNDLYKNNIKPEASALFDDVLRSPNSGDTRQEAIQLNVQHDSEQGELQNRLSGMENDSPSNPREP